MPIILDQPDSGGTSLRQVVNATSDNEFLEQLIESMKVLDHAELLTSLERTTNDREVEIENICTKNHHEFVRSISGLEHARQDCSGLGHEIVDLMQSYHSSAGNLAAQKKNLVDSRNVRQNVDESSQALKECLDVLRLSNQVHELVAKQNHYAALRALDDLQVAMQLNDTSRYKIGEMIEISIPATQKMIAEAVMADLNTWLYRIRDVSQYIGEVAFYHTEQRRTRHKDRATQDEYLGSFKLNSPIELVADEVEEYDVLNDEEAQLHVDFTPLFECLHIHEALGQMDRFRTEYASTRRKQRDLLIPSTLSLRDEEVVELKTLLESIAGFTVVERATVEKTENLRTTADVDELWDSMCQGTVTLVSASTLGVNDPDVLLRVIGVLSLFVQTMERQTLRSISLNALMTNLFQKYASLLKRRCGEDFEEIISSDDYMPMAVNDTEEYERIIDVSWYEPEKDGAEITFPAVFPFSQMYPMCCIDIRDYLSKVYATPDDFLQRSSTVDDTIRNALDDLLCNNVCQPLLDGLNSKYPGQIVQILTNFEHFESACTHIQGELLASRMYKARSAPKALAATSRFRAGREQAEQRIFELIGSKVDDLIGTAEYNWTTTQYVSEPSDYMTELTQYLSNVMSSVLLGLPEEIKELGYIDALTHAASEILTLPLDDSISSISQAALHQLDLDVSHLNDFVATLSFPASDPNPAPLNSTTKKNSSTPQTTAQHATLSQLQTTLLRLTQTFALMSSNNPDEFYNLETKNIHYSAVDPLHAPILLEKVDKGRTDADAPGPDARSSLTSLPPPDRTGTPVGRVGTPANAERSGTTLGKMGLALGSPTSPNFNLQAGTGDTAAQKVREGMQGLERGIMAGSERFMRGFRRGEGSGAGSGSGTGGGGGAGGGSSSSNSGSGSGG